MLCVFSWFDRRIRAGSIDGCFRECWSTRPRPSPRQRAVLSPKKQGSTPRFSIQTLLACLLGTSRRRCARSLTAEFFSLLGELTPGSAVARVTSTVLSVRSLERGSESYPGEPAFFVF